MNIFETAKRMELVHSDIRGPLFVEANRMAAEGTQILRLNTGNPATFGFAMPDSIKNALIENIDKATGYCAVNGMPSACQAIYEYHLARGIKDITPDSVYIGNGVSEVAYMAVTSLIDEGDEVLVPMPSYSMWTNLCHLADAKPVFYVCDEQSDWNPDVADMRSKITSKTKAMVIINPNNPTGALYPDEILLEMLQIARENNLIVFSDEIYDRLLLDGRTHTSSAALAPDLTVLTFNGLSKSHIICGLRSGWLVVSGKPENSKKVIDTIQKLAAMRLCGNTAAQLVIPAALEDSASTQEMLVPGGRLYEQRAATIKALGEIPDISCVPNKAAFYLFPKIHAKKYNITDDRLFALDVLHATNILMIPGSGFDWPEPNHFRLVMLPEADEIYKCILKIGDFLDGYNQQKHKR